MKAQKFAAGCMGLSLLLFAYYFITDGSLADLESSLMDLESEHRTMAFNVKNAENQDVDISKVKELSATILNKTVQPEQEALTIRYFYKLEEGSGVHLEYPRLKEKGEFDLNSFTPLHYAMQVTGPYVDCMNFIDTIASGTLWSRVIKAKVTSEKDEEGISRVDLSLLLLASK